MPKITYYNSDYKPLSQRLRREMTRQEKHLWYDFLKSYPIPFRRQKQFGHCIVDFYCAMANFVVELDGSQHYEPEEKQRDAERDQYLSSLGLAVLRFGNYDVDRHFDSVCATIDRSVKERLDATQNQGHNAVQKPSLGSTQKPSLGAIQKPSLGATQKPSLGATQKPSPVGEGAPEGGG